MHDLASFKLHFIELHGYWNNGLEQSLEADPFFFGEYLKMADVALAADHLDKKTRDFVLIAASAAVTHLHLPAVEAHIVGALNNGATKQELLEVLQITSVLGIHGYMVGAPMLIKELRNSKDETLKQSFPMDERAIAVKKEFSEQRHYWSPLLEDLVRASPDFFNGYTAFSSAPWKTGTLPPKIKELIYVAIDVSTTHLFEPGTRIHMRNALRLGATPDQVLQVIEIVSCIGMQSYLASVPPTAGKVSKPGGPTGYVKCIQINGLCKQPAHPAVRVPMLAGGQVYSTR
jgi:alkylhydroperoxidase/carboxymuconolactone decarboxylase family protein YurZ